MGVTIHYRGHINQKNTIQKFIEEVADICQSMDWDYDIMDENWAKPSKLAVEHTEEGVTLQGHAGLKGVTFKPHDDCEPVRLTFDAKRQLNSIMNLAFGFQDEDTFPWNFTKTQFAGVETHISILKLFKYLKKKYISDLEVKDEGNYWESGDTGELQSRMNMIDNAMSALQEGLEGLADEEDLTEDMILKKIEDVIQNLGDQEGIQIKVLRIDNVLKELDPDFFDELQEIFEDEEDFEDDLKDFLNGNLETDSVIDEIEEEEDFDFDDFDFDDFDFDDEEEEEDDFDKPF